MRGRRPALIAVAYILGIADALHAESIRVRDAYDRIVTLRAPPQRIIPVYSSNVELVAALGLADRIVGIEAFTRYPPEIPNRTRIGGRLGISVDATVALEPDLVIVTPGRQAVFQLVVDSDPRPDATQHGGDIRPISVCLVARQVSLIAVKPYSSGLA
jgi:iron complex transport system substrate-binding protein